MSISIRNPRAEQLAREVAEMIHTTMTDAIIEALEEKKARSARPSASETLRLDKILEIAGRCASLPDLDIRSSDQIPGYGDEGVF